MRNQRKDKSSNKYYQEKYLRMLEPITETMHKNIRSGLKI